MLPEVCVQVLQGLNCMQTSYSHEWTEMAAMFQKTWDSLPDNIKLPPGATRNSYRFDKKWSDSAHLLVDSNMKQLGYMNVAALYYSRKDLHNKVSRSYDNDTEVSYASEVGFKSTKDPKDCVKQNAHAFQKTTAGKAQSGKLMYERVKHIQAVVAWEEEHMTSGLKDSEGKVRRTWYNDDRNESEWPVELWAEVENVRANGAEFRMHKRLIQIYEDWPFLLRMNDDREKYVSLKLSPPVRFSYVAMKRAEGVTQAYFKGKCCVRPACIV